MRLPSAIEPPVFHEKFRPDLGAWRAAVVEVCAAHGLECGDVTAFKDGSNLVAAIDERWVVKIYPPFHAYEFESERRVLAHLNAHPLPLKLPRLLAQGTRDEGWTYLVSEKLAGVLLEASWPSFTHAEKARALGKIGETMAAVHDLPVGELRSLPPEWHGFLDSQRANCRKRHAGFDVPAWFVDGVEALTAAWTPASDSRDHVILTGEYTPFNLLAQQDGAGWHLTGMFDLGDGMVGPREYDLLGPSMFSCEGDPRLVRALFLGYFGQAHTLNHAARMQLMALAVLHRYSNFNVQLRIPHWQGRAQSFEALAELVWPSDSGLG